jgi:hypothetical protein
MNKVELSQMKSINMKNVALTVLSMFVLGWLLFVWAPMIRKNNETFEKTEEVIRDSKATIEKVKSEIERIEKTTHPQIPQIPDSNGMVL